MTKMNMIFASAAAGLLLASAQLQAGWGVGVRIGGPAYYPYRPWTPYYYPYYPYRAVYVEPPPIIVESPPIVVQSAPAVQVGHAVTPSPLPPPAILRSSQIQNAAPEIDRSIQQLRDPDERVRSDGVLQLGRLKAISAVDSVAATLAGDRSPMVREAAARALGLMGSPKALPALLRAASADPDHDVRHSAQFAVDIIQSGR